MERNANQAPAYDFDEVGTQPEYPRDAECLKDNVDFYPVGTKGKLALMHEQQAKQICRVCPVIDACLEGALERGEQYGVWGGTSEEERKLIRRQRRALRKSNK